MIYATIASNSRGHSSTAESLHSENPLEFIPDSKRAISLIHMTSLCSIRHI